VNQVHSFYSEKDSGLLTESRAKSPNLASM
jgi:hypothetical protein